MSTTTQRLTMSTTTQPGINHTHTASAEPPDQPVRADTRQIMPEQRPDSTTPQPPSPSHTRGGPAPSASNKSARYIEEH